MIRPAKLFELAVKHQAEQNKNAAASAEDAVNNTAAKADDSENKAPAAEETGRKKAWRRIKSIQPKIGPLL